MEFRGEVVPEAWCSVGYGELEISCDGRALGSETEPADDTWEIRKDIPGCSSGGA